MDDIEYVDNNNNDNNNNDNNYLNNQNPLSGNNPARERIKLRNEEKKKKMAYAYKKHYVDADYDNIVRKMIAQHRLKYDKCTMCKGYSHKANYCGNIFTMDKQLKHTLYNKAWKLLKFKSLDKNSPFYEKKAERLKAANVELFNEENIKEYEIQYKDDLEMVHEFSLTNKKNLYCNFCNGNGHLVFECGASWMLKKKSKGSEGIEGALNYIIKTDYYEKEIKEINKVKSQQLSEYVSKMKQYQVDYQ